MTEWEIAFLLMGILGGIELGWLIASWRGWDFSDRPKEKPWRRVAEKLETEKLLRAKVNP